MQSLVSDRAAWSFAQLLDWHLSRGTRPSKSPQIPGASWTNKEFASCLGNDERTVRNWRYARNTPSEIASVERELLGDSDGYAEWRSELREAYRRTKPRDVEHELTSSHSGSIISLPYPSLGSLFKGRDELLLELHTSLSRSVGRTAITASAVYGLGGVGKTRTAVEYAWRYQHEYTALLFVIAETPEALRRNLAGLVGPLVLNLPEKNFVEEELRLKAAIEWLMRHPGWLLILDSLDQPETLTVADSLLGKLSGGHILVTSRLSNFAGHFDPVELDVLAQQDAVAFLLERTEKRRRKEAEDEQDAETLALDLGYLALALEHAGAYIAKLNISFAHYGELWRENWEQVALWTDESITKYPRAVAVTWKTTVDQLSPAGLRLLNWLSWFSTEPIPNYLLTFPVADLAENDLDQAVANLADYSLIRRSFTKDEFAIHRLVQDVTRRGLNTQTRLPSLTQAVLWMASALDADTHDLQRWLELDHLAPHALALVKFATDAGIKEESLLMSPLAVLFRVKAQYAPAEELCRKGLAICEMRYGPNDPSVAAYLTNLSVILRDTRRLSEAEVVCRRALEISQQALGASHPRVATCLSNLAGVLETTSRVDEAEQLLRRAIDIDSKYYGDQHPEVGTDLNNLAKLLRTVGRITEAESLFRRALDIEEKRYGREHPNIAQRLNNLAELLRDGNRLTEAEPLYKRALTIYEKAHPLGHPNLATAINNYGELLRNKKQFGEAEPLYRRALKMFEESLGPNHPDVAMVLNNLSLILRDRPGEAELFCRRALSIDEHNYGTEHPDVALDLNNLAGLLRETGRPDEAEPLCRRALTILSKFSREAGYQHQNLEAFVVNYYVTLAHLGRSKSEREAAINSVLQGT
jgi:tetratricopeptide (TPR) repeat protein